MTLILLLSAVIQNILVTHDAYGYSGHDRIPVLGKKEVAAPAPVAHSPDPSPSPSMDLETPQVKEMKELLGACDKALDSCDKLVKDKNEKLKLQNEIITNRDKQIQHLRDDSNSIIKNPVLWFVIGTALGVIAGGIALRR